MYDKRSAKTAPNHYTASYSGHTGRMLHEGIHLSVQRWQHKLSTQLCTFIPSHRHYKQANICLTDLKACSPWQTDQFYITPVEQNKSKTAVNSMTSLSIGKLFASVTIEN